MKPVCEIGNLLVRVGIGEAFVLIDEVFAFAELCCYLPKCPAANWVRSRTPGMGVPARWSQRSQNHHQAPLERAILLCILRTLRPPYPSRRKVAHFTALYISIQRNASGVLLGSNGFLRRLNSILKRMF